MDQQYFWHAKGQAYDHKNTILKVKPDAFWGLTGDLVMALCQMLPEFWFGTGSCIFPSAHSWCVGSITCILQSYSSSAHLHWCCWSAAALSLLRTNIVIAWCSVFGIPKRRGKTWTGSQRREGEEPDERLRKG
ncbi:unnamed protein product [Pleuronectes platessa]|uniref:Uncharacterized protein n=1 Tax=Pleuronectes platessa TaxID=8262 RepID=A0A9N7Y1K9_PLEPL|nr:unnamed protein product [Pleuronectes platessa]